MSDPHAAERSKLADRFDRYARRVLLLTIPVALIASLDLLTRWFTGDRRLAVGLFVAVGCALGRVPATPAGSTLAYRGTPDPSHVDVSLVSFAATLALTAGLGYLVGGWVLAVVLPSATIVVMAGSAAIGIRRERRVTTEH